MKILRTYILKDFFSTFIFSLVLLNMVMILGNLGFLARKGINLADTLKIFSLSIPYLLRYTLPFSLLLGILLAMGRLTTDNEILAMSAAGISIFRILKIFLIVGVILFLFLLFLNNSLIPEFQYRYRTEIKNIGTKNISAFIEPGIFLDGFENFILYISDMQDSKMKNVFIYEISDREAVTKVTFAKSGEFVVEGTTLTLRLQDGFHDSTPLKDKKGMYRLKFEQSFMHIPIATKKAIRVNKKASDMTFKELTTKIKELEDLRIAPREFIAEAYKRFSYAFSALTFILLGFGLSLMIKHREKSINFGVAFFVAGIYYLLFAVGEALVEYRIVIPSLGIWLPNILVAGFALLLLYKYVYHR